MAVLISHSLPTTRTIADKMEEAKDLKYEENDVFHYLNVLNTEEPKVRAVLSDPGLVHYISCWDATPDSLDIEEEEETVAEVEPAKWANGSETCRLTSELSLMQRHFALAYSHVCCSRLPKLE